MFIHLIVVVCLTESDIYGQVQLRDINVYVNLVHWFQGPNVSFRSGMSSLLEVVITSWKSEVSLKSNVS